VVSSHQPDICTAIELTLKGTISIKYQKISYNRGWSNVCRTINFINNWAREGERDGWVFVSAIEFKLRNLQTGARETQV